MAGRATRESEAEIAARIVTEEVEGFLRGRAERAAVPALNELRGHFEDVREQVLAEAGGDAEKATRLLVNRLLHEPSEAILVLPTPGNRLTRAARSSRTCDPLHRLL